MKIIELIIDLSLDFEFDHIQILLKIEIFGQVFVGKFLKQLQIECKNVNKAIGLYGL